MSNRQFSNSAPRVGINKDSHLSQLKETEYSHAKNSNTQSNTGDGVVIQSEPSNILTSIFAGSSYKLIGHENHVNKDRTYVFLTNPTTGLSQIGYVSNLQNIENENDLELECGDCDYKNKLNTPLEDTTQVPTHQYTVLLEDSCNGCLNFSIDHPIFYIEIKEEVSGTKIFWTDNYNEQRYLDLDRIEEYKRTGDFNCGIDNTEPTCLNCEKLKMFPTYKPMQIVPDTLQVGGNLRRAAYEFAGAYSNKEGVEITDYHSITQPTYILDRENNIISDTELADRTAYAIKLNVKYLDTKFTHYKVVVIMTTDQSTSYYEVGVFSTSDSSVIFTTEDNKNRFDVNSLFQIKPIYKKAEILTQSNGILFQGNVEQEPEWNLQPVVNFMGSFAKWMTIETSEHLYQNGLLAAKFKGRMRDEVYPHGIRFLTNTGYKTAVFPLIARPPLTEELEEVDNLDTRSVLENATNCTSTDRNKRWQFYNTATNDGVLNSYNPSGLTTQRDVAKYCITSDIFESDPGEITLNLDDFEDFSYSTLENFVKDYYDVIINATCDVLAPNYNAGFCTLKTILLGDYIGCDDPTVLFPDACDDETFPCCDEPVLLPEFTQVLIQQTEFGTNTPITLTGTSGTAEITIGGEDYLVTFNTDLETTASDFFNTHAAALEELNIQISVSGVIISVINLNQSSTAPIITNLTGDLDGTVGDTEELIGEGNEFIERDFPDEYLTSPPPKHCDPFERDDEGKFIEAADMELGHWGDKIWTRISNLFQEKCSGADEIIFKADRSVIGQGYHLDLYGTWIPGIEDEDDLVDENYTGLFTGTVDLTTPLLTALVANPFIPLPASALSADYTTNLHKGALWFKGSIGDGTRTLLEVSPFSDNVAARKAFMRIYERVPMRVSIWLNCNLSGGSPIFSTVFNSTEGILIDIDTEREFEDDGTTPNPFYKVIRNNFFVTIDAPISRVPAWSYVVAMARCFSIFTRPVEFKQVVVTYDSIVLEKRERYEASCTFSVPQPDDCDPQAYETGEFAYWESLETYPDNPELYDSSRLLIEEEDIPEDILTKFEDYYMSSKTDGVYRLKNSNFTCQPIRHFKYPDSKVTPFTAIFQTAPFARTIIYPIGFTIDEDIIVNFLDLAVKNNLITQTQRNSIVGYELFTGDRTGNKSVQAKGIAFDSYNYQEQGKTIEYPNFPFNDLGDNFLFKDSLGSNLRHPKSSTKNNKFSILSPDLYNNQSFLPTEVNIEGYLFGNSKSTIVEVKDHPKWVLLGKRGKRTATQLAVLEATTEGVLNATESLETFRIAVGVSSAFNIVGAILYIASRVLMLTNLFVKVGQYRLQWLRTFKDLGKPYNFANRITGVGDYSFLEPNEEPENQIRGISAIRKMGMGRHTITDNKGNINYVNNEDREQSLFVSFGSYEGLVNQIDFDLEYPTNYVNYDNNRTNYSLSSRFTGGQENCSEQELIKNVASPYFSLKNYNPAQYGGINNIQWLSTSYFGFFNNPNPEPRIFGGDTFISRFAEIRKIPMFLTTAMGQASLTPFEYKRYSNLGLNPTYYCDYELEETDGFTVGRALFPDLDSSFNLDCLTNSGGFYITPPTKFYLYYHGIPTYIVESEINSHFRYAKEGLENSFYPQEQDYKRLTEQVERPIRTQNTLFYNKNAYSKTVTQIGYRTLPITYSRELYDKIAKGDNTTIYSEPDNSEYDFTDPWLIYKPLNFFHFPTKNGRLKDIREVESAQLLARFENMFAIFNALDNINRITPQTQVTGTGGIFAQRPLEFNKTELGFAGTQNKAMVSCEFGHFWADAERGQVFMAAGGGGNSTPQLQEISRIYGGEPTGMRNWFKEHLPFKIKKSNIGNAENINIDNPFKGIGITMGWDSRFERVFLTKRDYKMINKQASLCYHDNGFYNTSNEVTEPLIEQYEVEDWEYQGIENCKLKFTKEVEVTFENNTNIYVFYDATSMNIADATEADTAIQAWFNNLTNINPSYSGNLYRLPVLAGERWMTFASYPQTGLLKHYPGVGGYPDQFMAPGTVRPIEWNNLKTLPPGVDSQGQATVGFVPDPNAIVISFVDEAYQAYHHNANPPDFTTTRVQPTEEYREDFNDFLSVYNNFEFFRYLAYPIVRFVSGNIPGSMQTQNNLLQILAAIKGTTIPSGQLPVNLGNNGSPVDLSAITSTNPYSEFGSLEQYNFKGVYTKYNPVDFTQGEIEAELNQFLEEESITITETLFVDLPKIELTNQEYFKDVSWTMAFSPILGKWISYYDFKPNYYIAQKNYFQTGINYSTTIADSQYKQTEFGLWSHLLTNRSYQVFYGKAYKFEIDFPVQNKGGKRVLETITYDMEALRYHNDYDFSETSKIGMDELVVYNNTNNSGLLKLITQTNVAQNRNYPNTVGNNYQEILQTNDEGVWNINYFFNRVKNQDSNVNPWIQDDNQIDKELNKKAVSFYGKKVLERMRGQEFAINLKSSDTLHKKIIKVFLIKENIYI
jgi:hypothetical protein